MNQKNLRLPLIPLRGLTIFPNMVLHFDVGRDKSVEAIEAAMKNNETIFLVSQKDSEIENPTTDEISRIGTISTIKQIIKLQGKTLKVLVEGKSRGRIKRYYKNDKYFEASIEPIVEEDYRDDPKVQGYFNTLKEVFIQFINLAGESNPEMIKSIEKEDNVNDFVDMVSSYVPIREEKKQIILESLDIFVRVEELLKCLHDEIEIIKVQKTLATKMKKSVDDSQKEYYLKEQMKFIQEELGEDDEETKLIKKYEKQVSELKAPKEIKEKAEYELGRLKNMNASSSEGNTIESYLDWLLGVPWNKTTKEKLDIVKAREILDKQHYGLEDVKDRIIEYLAAKKISGSLKGPILCLVGPPGVGKTSIAKSIADAINRKYFRMSLGGIRDEAEIRGHRRTYVAAIPGRIVYGLKEAKSMNPLIVLDEIDKLSQDYKGNPADALLEVLDSEQNNTFRDNFLEVPIDLSKVMFITTANSLDTIPRPLLDRMEVVEVSGYTYEEKFHIAKDFLIPKLYKEYNISSKTIKISDESIKEIIDGYTRESGVRSLERTIASLMRKSMAKILKENKKSIAVNTKMVTLLLGERKFDYDKVQKSEVGVVNGMAWTAYGGDTLKIEAAVMEGTGKLQLTGKLGDVMQESAKAAYSYVRANCSKYGIDKDFYKNKDIHIHVPEGAVPKDGPSAGVTMVTALVSALIKKEVKSNVAMTGEVTLTGRVLPIGGLKEKTLAAYRAGVDTIIIPKENERDIKKIPVSIRKKIKVITAEKVDTVVKNAIAGEDINDN